MKPNLIIAFLCCVLFISCKKSKNDSPTAQKLIAGKWQITASIVTYYYHGKDTTIDYYSGWRTCEQDDFMELTDKGKGTQNENTNKCPEDAQQNEFNWELLDNDNKLKITFPNGQILRSNKSNTITSDIVEITDSILKLRYTNNTDSIPAITVETYKNIN